MLKNPCKHWYCLLDAKMLWQPGQSFILTGFVFSLPCQILADLSTWSKERDQLRSSTPCATVLIIRQLLPTHMQPASWNKAKFSVEGLRPDTFWFLRCPACPCTGLFFLLEYYPSPNKIDSTQFINYKTETPARLYSFPNCGTRSLSRWCTSKAIFCFSTQQDDIHSFLFLTIGFC